MHSYLITRIRSARQGTLNVLVAEIVAQDVASEEDAEVWISSQIEGYYEVRRVQVPLPPVLRPKPIPAPGLPDPVSEGWVRMPEERRVGV